MPSFLQTVLMLLESFILLKFGLIQSSKISWSKIITSDEMSWSYLYEVVKIFWRWCILGSVHSMVKFVCFCLFRRCVFHHESCLSCFELLLLIKNFIKMKQIWSNLNKIGLVWWSNEDWKVFSNWQVWSNLDKCE